MTEPESGPSGSKRLTEPHAEDGWTEDRIEAINEDKVTNPVPYGYPVMEGKITDRMDDEPYAE